MKSVCVLVQSVYDFDPRVRRKAEALVAAGYTVDVLALRPAHHPKTYSLNGVNVFTLALGKKRGSLVRYFFEYAAFFAWAFVRVPLMMQRRRYSVIDVNTLPDFLIFAPILAKWMGARLVLDMHEITPEFYISKYGIAERSVVIRLLKLLERASFHFADHVITINTPICELLQRRGLPASKSTVIMNAADEARFKKACESSSAEPGPAAPHRFVMMYHGTLTRLYGLDIAIEAFGEVHREMPGAELWILGSGPEASALAGLARKRGVSSRVRLPGQIPAADIPAWLDQSDIGVLPIRRDIFLDYAFPNKLPEYIISGRPVVISRLNAIEHYFTDEALAYFEPDVPGALAAQMLRLYRDHRLRRRLAECAAAQYGAIRWEVMRQRYLDLVASLACPARVSADASHATRTSS